MMKKALSKKKGQLSKEIGLASKKLGQYYSILEFFYENPSISLTVRALASHLGKSKSSVQYYLEQLKLEGIISADNKWVDSWFNRVRKTNYYVEMICTSGVIDYLEEQLGASAIILFGSVRKGESVRDSDIDLFVECARSKEVDLHSFEKKLGHKIQLFTKPKITLLPAHLLNNVVNGIKLKGYFTIK